jgi:hypothetical protein
MTLRISRVKKRPFRNGNPLDYKISGEIKAWFRENLDELEVTIDNDGRLLDIPKNKTALNYKDHDVKKIDIPPTQSLTRTDDNQPPIQLAHIGSISEVSIDIFTGKVKPSRIEGSVFYHLDDEVLPDWVDDEIPEHNYRLAGT